MKGGFLVSDVGTLNQFDRIDHVILFSFRAEPIIAKEFRTFKGLKMKKERIFILSEGSVSGSQLLGAKPIFFCTFRRVFCAR